MRAVTQERFGEAEDVLDVTEVPDPEAGPGQVLVRTVLAAIHNHDLWTIRGTYGFKPELPARTGTEAVGVIEALGDGVTGLEVGQRVVTGTTFGVWAERFVANAAAVTPVPEGIDDEAAAQLFAMPFSAISLLDFLGLAEGQWIVQNAANGAVGRLLAQLAAARGVHVLGLVRRGAGVEELAAVGIGNVVATDSDDWQERARAIIGDAGAAVGVDSLGGEASGQVLSLLGDGGTLVAFGAMASPVMDIRSGDVIFRHATVKGFWGSKVSAEMDPAKRRSLLAEVIERVLSGALTLPVEAVYSFDDVRNAAAANSVPGRAGKILLRP